MQHFIEEEEINHKKNKIKLFFFKILFAPILSMAARSIIRNLENKKKEKRYKKIIKKGLFWDTEYLIEKD